MRVVVFSYTEEPYVLENVTRVDTSNDPDIVIEDSVDGILPVNLEDVMRVELSK